MPHPFERRRVAAGMRWWNKVERVRIHTIICLYFGAIHCKTSKQVYSIFSFWLFKRLVHTFYDCFKKLCCIYLKMYQVLVERRIVLLMLRFAMSKLSWHESRIMGRESRVASLRVRYMTWFCPGARIWRLSVLIGPSPKPQRKNRCRK